MILSYCLVTTGEHDTNLKLGMVQGVCCLTGKRLISVEQISERSFLLSLSTVNTSSCAMFGQFQIVRLFVYKDARVYEGRNCSFSPEVCSFLTTCL